MLPAKEIILKVDVEKVRRMGIVPEGMDSLIVPEMRLHVRRVVWRKKTLPCLTF